MALFKFHHPSCSTVEIPNNEVVIEPDMTYEELDALHPLPEWIIQAQKRDLELRCLIEERQNNEK